MTTTEPPAFERSRKAGRGGRATRGEAGAAPLVGGAPLRAAGAAAPWAALDPSLGPPLRATLPALVEEVLDAVRGSVPAYAAPLEGAFGRNVRIGVEQALAGFVELVEAGPEAALPGREVYVRLGRGEVRAGRELDALLGAYRAGAQVAWRRLAEAAAAAGAPPDALIRLAEAVFAFIDELSSASAEGYAEASALAAGERQDRRRRLLELLLADPPAAAADVAAAAEDAGWRVPPSLAVLAVEHDRPARLAARLPPDALVGGTRGAGVAVIPDARGPARLDAIRAAVRDRRAALGPEVAPPDAALSAARAARALELVAGDGGLVLADDHLLDLLVGGDERLAADLAARRLAPLDALPAPARDRLEETLRAWLDHHGEARPAAAALHVHVQTVRYRLGRLRELLGDALDDPRARLELAVALHARDVLRRAAGSPAGTATG